MNDIDFQDMKQFIEKNKHNKKVIPDLDGPVQIHPLTDEEIQYEWDRITAVRESPHNKVDGVPDTYEEFYERMREKDRILLRRGVIS